MPIASFNVRPAWRTTVMTSGILFLALAVVQILNVAMHMIVLRSILGYSIFEGLNSFQLVLLVAWILLGVGSLKYAVPASKPPALVIYDWGFVYRLDQAVFRSGGVYWSEVTSITQQTYGLANVPVLCCTMIDPERINAAATPFDSWFSSTKNRRRTQGISINLRAFNAPEVWQITQLMWQRLNASRAYASVQH